MYRQIISNKEEAHLRTEDEEGQPHLQTEDNLLPRMPNWRQETKHSLIYTRKVHNNK
jgi:hypothetical protein